MCFSQWAAWVSWRVQQATNHFRGGNFLCGACVLVVVQKVRTQKQYTLRWQWGYEVLYDERIFKKRYIWFVLRNFRRTGSRVEAKCWFARVPSYSNNAHKPSPGMAHELLAAGWCKDEFAQVFFAVEHRVAFMRKKWGKRANALLCSPGEKKCLNPAAIVTWTAHRNKWPSHVTESCFCSELHVMQIQVNLPFTFQRGGRAGSPICLISLRTHRPPRHHLTFNLFPFEIFSAKLIAQRGECSVLFHTWKTVSQTCRNCQVNCAQK